MADMLATSTEAEEDTPLPSGTVEETYMDKLKKLIYSQNFEKKLQFLMRAVKKVL